MTHSSVSPVHWSAVSSLVLSSSRRLQETVPEKKNKAATKLQKKADNPINNFTSFEPKQQVKKACAIFRPRWLEIFQFSLKPGSFCAIPNTAVDTEDAHDSRLPGQDTFFDQEVEG